MTIRELHESKYFGSEKSRQAYVAYCKSVHERLFKNIGSARHASNFNPYPSNSPRQNTGIDCSSSGTDKSVD